MKRLHFEYMMNLEFQPPVGNHRFTLKCVPQSGPTQSISNLSTEVYPNEFLSTDLDSFGNHCIYGRSADILDHFSVAVSGDAVTGLNCSEPAADPCHIGIFKYQTEHTKPGEHLLAFAARNAVSNQADNFEIAMHYMRRLYEFYQYKSGVTCISTTAEEAMALGAGVCQDYAHILLSLCRMHQIPCRYVTGMMIGEGLSHAWVEVAVEGQWIALDPTNNLRVFDDHIKISVGRDYKDCMINQGVFYGFTTQIQKIHVSVSELQTV